MGSCGRGRGRRGCEGVGLRAFEQRSFWGGSGLVLDLRFAEKSLKGVYYCINCLLDCVAFLLVFLCCSTCIFPGPSGDR